MDKCHHFEFPSHLFTEEGGHAPGVIEAMCVLMSVCACFLYRVWTCLAKGHEEVRHWGVKWDEGSSRRGLHAAEANSQHPVFLGPHTHAWMKRSHSIPAALALVSSFLLPAPGATAGHGTSGRHVV